eukprot:365130-Chlamydomonas_euryale.AAC.6
MLTVPNAPIIHGSWFFNASSCAHNHMTYGQVQLEKIRMYASEWYTSARQHQEEHMGVLIYRIQLKKALGIRVAGNT